MALPYRGDAQRLGGGGHAGAAFGDGVVDYGRHARVDRRRVDRARIGLRADEFAHRAVDLQHFEDADASAVADAGAALAALRLIDGLARLEAERRILRVGV